MNKIDQWLASNPKEFDPNKSFGEHRAAVNAEFERQYVMQLLVRNGGCISKAAREAQMDRKHLLDLAKRVGLGSQERNKMRLALRAQLAAE